jgi:RNA polymerase sigma-70 factor (ECF subfamily)
VEQDWTDIIRRCQQGDADAWKEFVEAHRGFVYSLCYSITGSSRDADDLVQDAFIKIHNHLAGFDPARGDLRGWITVLTRNQLVDHFRRSRMQRATVSMDAGWEGNDTFLLADQLEDASPSPHEQVAAREIEHLVHEAIGQIPPRMREAVSLRYFHRMNYREIAQKLRVPEGTIKSRINRAHAELAGLLSPRRSALGFAQQGAQ